MKNFKRTLIIFAVSLCSVVVSVAQDETEENLGTLLESTGWDVLVGTWLNPDGAEFVFSWQHPGTVLQMAAEVNGVKRHSVYVKQAKSRTVNVFAYNSGGSSSVGTCTFSQGVVEFVMKTHNSDTGEVQQMKFSYTLTGTDAFEAKMEGNDHVYKYTRK